MEWETVLAKRRCGVRGENEKTGVSCGGTAKAGPPGGYRPPKRPKGVDRGGSSPGDISRVGDKGGSSDGGLSSGGVPSASAAASSGAVPARGSRRRKRGGTGVRPSVAGPGGVNRLFQTRPEVRPSPPTGRVKAWPTTPKTVAVAINLGEGATVSSYVEAVRTARSRVSLSEMGFGAATMRRNANGLVFALSAPSGGENADRLAMRLREVLPRATVPRLVRRGKVRLVGLDESVLPQEVKEALVAVAACGAGDISLGAISGGRRGGGTALASLPSAAAVEAAKAHRVTLGWAVARIELLDNRPLQCHRCWRFDHTRASCSGQIDRSRNCYRCGGGCHLANGCREDAKCVLCVEACRRADHRLGGPACSAASKGPDSSRKRSRPIRRRGRPPNASGSAPGAPGGAQHQVAEKAREKVLSAVEWERPLMGQRRTACAAGIPSESSPLNEDSSPQLRGSQGLR